MTKRITQEDLDNDTIKVMDNKVVVQDTIKDMVNGTLSYVVERASPTTIAALDNGIYVDAVGDTYLVLNGKATKLNEDRSLHKGDMRCVGKANFNGEQGINYVHIVLPHGKVSQSMVLLKVSGQYYRGLTPFEFHVSAYFFNDSIHHVGFKDCYANTDMEEYEVYYSPTLDRYVVRFKFTKSTYFSTVRVDSMDVGAGVPYYSVDIVSSADATI